MPTNGLVSHSLGSLDRHRYRCFEHALHVKRLISEGFFADLKNLQLMEEISRGLGRIILVIVLPLLVENAFSTIGGTYVDL